MAIRINLLAEEQLKEEQRRNDPVKRGYWLAGMIVALMLLGCLYILGLNWSARSEARKLERDLQSLENKTRLIKTDVRNTVEIQSKLSALERLAAERFLWAPVLNALQFCMVEDIQLSQIKSQHNYILREEVKAKDKVKAQPAAAIETNSVTLVAKCDGDADVAVEKIGQFMRNLKAHDYLKNLLLTNNGVVLKNLGQPQVDALDHTKMTVMFTLECMFPERTRCP